MTHLASPDLAAAPADAASADGNATPRKATTDAARSRARLARRWWRREIVGSVDYERVVARVDEDAGWSARYAFMVVMSAGIAVLGLLLSSPAVIIGAMLISPLMGPIIGLGFALAIFDWREVRRCVQALAGGSLLAVLFAAAVVWLSPLQAVTPEILARTRPNLFDLLVAVFSALAGTYAMIRGRGETIVGVAIATALMPPLAVVGFGLATTNLAVFAGSLALFMTNLLAIALSAAVMARFYGFGTELSPRQTRQQAGLIILVFLILSVPLAFALKQIAWETIASRQIRAEIAEHFGEGAKVSQLEIDFAKVPLTASAVVLTNQFSQTASADISAALEERLGVNTRLLLNQIVVDQDLSRFAQERTALDQFSRRDIEADRLAVDIGLVAGIPQERILIDRQRRIVTATATGGVALNDLRAAEMRLNAAFPGWDIRLLPPFGPLPPVLFAAGNASIDEAAAVQIATATWALQRWNMDAATATGRAASGDDGTPGAAPALAQLRADAVVAALAAGGIEADAATDPAGPKQRAVEREGGFAPFRSVEIAPRAAASDVPVAPAPDADGLVDQGAAPKAIGQVRRGS